MVVLEPIDLFAINYLGPFLLATITRNRYILIRADYFSRFIFTKATLEVDRNTTFNFLINEVVKFIG